MSESSSISDVEFSPSTDSLDTLIGFATETGRTKAVSPSSSSAGPPASSDNALASSDSESRPVTPRTAEGDRTQNGHQDRVGRPAPPSGAHNEPAAAAASAATTGPGPPGPPVDLLAMLNRMQQQFQQQQVQQQQQQEVLAALMQQLLLGRQQAGPGDSRTFPASPPLPAPHSANPGQGHLLPPHAPPLCGQCDAGMVHICLHSPAPTARSEISAVGRRPIEPPYPPGPGQQCPPAPPGQDSRVGEWVEASEPSRRAPTPPRAAQEGAPSLYAGSVVSTAASRQGLNSNFKKPACKAQKRWEKKQFLSN